MRDPPKMLAPTCMCQNARIRTDSQEVHNMQVLHPQSNCALSVVVVVVVCAQGDSLHAHCQVELPFYFLRICDAFSPKPCRAQLCKADLHPRTQLHSCTADLTAASLIQSVVSHSCACELAPKFWVCPAKNITSLGAPGQLDNKNRARTSGKHHVQHIRSTARTGN